MVSGSGLEVRILGKKLIEVQDKLLSQYRITLCDGSMCKNDWSRTHVHPKKRMICKWTRKNSIQSTFTLLHEIGHIENNHSGMRRAEREYYATVWALDKAHELGLVIPDSVIKFYQEYIDYTKDRGVRRGGSGYGDLRL